MVRNRLLAILLTTLFLVGTAAPAEAHERRSRDRGSRSSRVQRGGDVWTQLARCESGGNPTARSRSGRYLGAFQFSMATWHSIGMEGDPRNHSYKDQLAAAQRLQARSGWGQWPRCSRRLGLR